jgi:hypothetical protein
MVHAEPLRHGAALWASSLNGLAGCACIAQSEPSIGGTSYFVASSVHSCVLF